MKRTFLLIIFFLLFLACNKDDNSTRTETITQVFEFTTVDEHEIEYDFVNGTFKATLIGSGGGGGGGADNGGLAVVAGFAGGGGGGSGQVVEIPETEIIGAGTLVIVIGAPGIGGSATNSGSNALNTTLTVRGQSNTLVTAVGGEGGTAGFALNPGNGGVGFPAGTPGVNGNSGENIGAAGGSGGDNQSGFGMGGNGGQGQDWDGTPPRSGSNGKAGFVRVEITGERIVNQ